ncbi:MAG: glycosyltransferase [bacterium]
MEREEQAHVLFVAHDVGLIGGAERQILEFFRGLNRKKFSPFLVCLEQGGPVAEGARKLEVPTCCITRKWRWDLSVIWRLRKFIIVNHIEILHAHLGLPGFYSVIAGKLSGAKVIATILNAGPRRIIMDFSERIAFLLSDKIIANSKAGVEYYLKNFPGRHKTVVIYNGYNLADFEKRPARTRSDLGLPESGLLIGHVANLTHLKDYPTFLKALAIVFEKHKECYGVIVGDGPMRRRYEQIAKDLKIDHRVIFLGKRSDVLDLVQHFDVGVLASHPTYSEGLSNSIAEYIGMGKPVVATDVGGNPELVENDINGFLAQPKNPQDFGEKILHLLNNPELRNEMGKRGQEFFRQNLSLEKMITATEKVYSDLLSKGKQR